MSNEHRLTHSPAATHPKGFEHEHSFQINICMIQMLKALAGISNQQLGSAVTMRHQPPHPAHLGKCEVTHAGQVTQYAQQYAQRPHFNQRLLGCAPVPRKVVHYGGGAATSSQLRHAFPGRPSVSVRCGGVAGVWGRRGVGQKCGQYERERVGAEQVLRGALVAAQQPQQQRQRCRVQARPRSTVAWTLPQSAQGEGGGASC